MSKAKQVTLRSGKVLLDPNDGHRVWVEGRKDGIGRKTLKWEPMTPGNPKELDKKALDRMIEQTEESLAELQEIKKILES